MKNPNAIIDYRNTYGTHETGGLVNGQEYHAQFSRDETVPWTEKGLKVTRLRLLSDPGFPAWDVSYCHGELEDGTKVHVELPFSQLPKKRITSAIIAHAKRDGVYAKGLGILDAISKLC